MMRVIMSVGPLRLESGAPGLSAYFLFPGDPQRPVVFAASLVEALPELQDITLGETLTCEPGLAQEASPLGIPVGGWSDEAKATLGILALEMATRDAFARIEREGLIFQFCRAAAAFQARHPEDWPTSLRLLDLVVAGREGALAGAIIAGPGLAVLDDPAALAAFDAAGIEEGTLDGLGAVLADGPPEIVDALRRAHGLDAIPEPFRYAGGSKLAADDNELAFLAAALFAIAGLDPRPAASATGRVVVDDCGCQVTAKIRRRPA